MQDRLKSDQNNHGYKILHDEEIIITIAEVDPLTITKIMKVKTLLMRYPLDLHIPLQSTHWKLTGISNMGCLPGVLYWFMTMPAHTLPLQHNISSQPSTWNNLITRHTAQTSHPAIITFSSIWNPSLVANGSITMKQSKKLLTCGSNNRH